MVVWTANHNLVYDAEEKSHRPSSFKSQAGYSLSIRSRFRSCDSGSSSGISFGRLWRTSSSGDKQKNWLLKRQGWQTRQSISVYEHSWDHIEDNIWTRERLTVPPTIAPIEASVAVLENVSQQLTTDGLWLNEVEEEIAGPTEVASRTSRCEKLNQGVSPVPIFVILTV